MKILPSASSNHERRGSALLVCFLILIVLVAIVTQLRITTITDARVGRNDRAISTMDQVIESALLKTYQSLLDDAEAAGAGGADPTAAPEVPGADPGAAPGGASESNDSRKDDWAKVDRTTINEIDLRIFIQDENSKIPLLSLLTADEDEADKALERVKRLLDMCREGTAEDIDSSDADRMAVAIREFMQRRRDDDLPKAAQLTDNEDNPDTGMLLTLRELVCVEPFEEHHFRDFRDEDGVIVHSLGSYLTTWSTTGTYQEFVSLRNQQQGQPEANEDTDPDDEDPGTPAPQAPGTEASGPPFGVNLNTAPPVVLKALMDERDVDQRWWDEVIEYRNLEEEPEEGEEELEPILDEYGEEIIDRQIFDSLEELSEIEDWEDMEPIVRAELLNHLTVESNVFSIYITARLSTSASADGSYVTSAAEAREQEEKGDSLVRTVRSVVMRLEGDDGWQIVPLVRWEVIDYVPYEILDYPDEER